MSSVFLDFFIKSLNSYKSIYKTRDNDEMLLIILTDDRIINALRAIAQNSIDLICSNPFSLLAMLPYAALYPLDQSAQETFITSILPNTILFGTLIKQIRLEILCQSIPGSWILDKLLDTKTSVLEYVVGYSGNLDFLKKNHAEYYDKIISNLLNDERLFIRCFGLLDVSNFVCGETSPAYREKAQNLLLNNVVEVAKNGRISNIDECLYNFSNLVSEDYSNKLLFKILLDQHLTAQLIKYTNGQTYTLRSGGYYAVLIENIKTIGTCYAGTDHHMKILSHALQQIGKDNDIWLSFLKEKIADDMNNGAISIGQRKALFKACSAAIEKYPESKLLSELSDMLFQDVSLKELCVAVISQNKSFYSQPAQLPLPAELIKEVEMEDNFLPPPPHQ